jgi:glycosyltransferase involved in cell wall biosynthesis
MQVVDSLALGGTERMAVNLANVLPRGAYRSFVCTTRQEGPLADQIHRDVGRLRLSRRLRFDVAAVRRLVSYVREHQIQILHAHGTALFMANLASFAAPYPKIVWHDHFGRNAIRERPVWIYRLLTWRVGAVVAVNEPLAEWSRRRLGIPGDRVNYLPNFAGELADVPLQGELPGVPGKRIVQVANLRRVKDHFTALKAMQQVVAACPGAHLLMVGAPTDLAYLREVEREIHKLSLENHVTLLGQRRDVAAIMKSCDLGLLSSRWEGFPLVLLEYSLANLPTVATRTGQCADMVVHGNCGYLVEPGGVNAMANALLQLLASSNLRDSLGRQFHKHVQNQYGAAVAARRTDEIYRNVLRSDRGKAPCVR